MQILVDELPENCDKCKYYTQFDNGMGCMITQELRPMDEKENYIQPDCPLIDIKTHDRELVKEACEKIRSELEKELKYDFTSYVPIMNVCNKINRVLDQIQKEYEK